MRIFKCLVGAKRKSPYSGHIKVTNSFKIQGFIRNWTIDYIILGVSYITN